MKLDYYQDIKTKLRALELPHREYVRVCREAFSQAALAEPSSVIMIVGPTRAGKSRVVSHLAEMLVQPISQKNPDLIPLIVVEAATANSGFFSMKHFTLRALAEIRHPIFGGIDPKGNTYVPRIAQTETTLRLALERGLSARMTRYMIVDEAHHLLRSKSSSRSGEILDSLKCLANTNKLVLVLVGGYELLTVGLGSAHINGRLKIVHFPRYKTIKDDIREYDRVLLSLDRILPTSGFSLLQYRESLYSGSAGVVGLLIEWAESAIGSMMSERRKYIEKIDFERTRIVGQITKINEEIKNGESQFKALDFSSEKNSSSAVTRPHKEPVQGRKSRKAFTRKPSRDPVST